MMSTSAIPGPTPWWQPVLRGERPVAVLLGLAPADQVVMVWPSADADGANVLALNSLFDVAGVRVDGPPLREPLTPKYSALVRRSDPSGVSGTGIVAIVAEVHPLRPVVVAWIGQSTGVQSVARYPSVDGLDLVHGHHGDTTLEPWPCTAVEVDIPLLDGRALR